MAPKTAEYLRFCTTFWQPHDVTQPARRQPVKVPGRRRFVNFLVNPEKLHGFSCTHYYTGVSSLPTPCKPGRCRPCRTRANTGTHTEKKKKYLYRHGAGVQVSRFPPSPPLGRREPLHVLKAHVQRPGTPFFRLFFGIFPAQPPSENANFSRKTPFYARTGAKCRFLSQKLHFVGVRLGAWSWAISAYLLNPPPVLRAPTGTRPGVGVSPCSHFLFCIR